MHAYGVTDEDFSRVSVKARGHGARNPIAHLQSEVTLEEVMGSRETASSLRQLHCCPVNDGAAAVVVAAADVAGIHPSARLTSEIRIKNALGHFCAGLEFDDHTQRCPVAE